MDFASVLGRVSTALEDAGHPWAIVGGVALAAYGLARTTLDLDLVVPSAAQGMLIDFMESAGYETLHLSSGYSNHLHADRSLGRVDFVYVGGTTAEQLFSMRRAVSGPGDATVYVPKPEHLIAMKVLALKNDPARLYQEMADIRHLLLLPGVDRQEVRLSFERHGLGDRYRELEANL